MRCPRITTKENIIAFEMEGAIRCGWLSHNTGRSQSISGGKLVLPISAAMIVTGVVVPYGDLADPGLAGSRRGMEDEQRQFIARGEQVCAV